ncbi:UpxY family transcription antiterminator [Flavitalea flava]
MNNFVAGWYVIYTKPQHEKKVSSRLSETGMEYFLPTVKTLRIWHDRKKYIDTPLFPSYIFVLLRDRQNYYSGLDIEGVLHYVRTGKEIARVSDKIIGDIKMIIDRGKEIEVSVDYFKAGQQLIIREGPLTGLSCEVVEINGKRRFLVRVNLLQRNLLITLPSECLMAIPV